MNELYFAWYSKTAHDYFGYVIYKKPNGEEIVCTTVSENESGKPSWDDTMFVGMVLSPKNDGFVKSCMLPTFERRLYHGKIENSQI